MKENVFVIGILFKPYDKLLRVDGYSRFFIEINRIANYGYFHKDLVVLEYAFSPEFGKGGIDSHFFKNFPHWPDDIANEPPLFRE